MSPKCLVVDGNTMVDLFPHATCPYDISITSCAPALMPKGLPTQYTLKLLVNRALPLSPVQAESLINEPNEAPPTHVCVDRKLFHAWFSLYAFYIGYTLVTGGCWRLNGAHKVIDNLKHSYTQMFHHSAVLGQLIRSAKIRVNDGQAVIHMPSVFSDTISSVVVEFNPPLKDDEVLGSFVEMVDIPAERQNDTAKPPSISALNGDGLVCKVTEEQRLM